MQRCDQPTHFDKHSKVIHTDGAVAHNLYANDSGDLWGKIRTTQALKNVLLSI